MDTSDYTIEVRDLAKRFGEVEAVKQVSFAVRAGELFGFLGPNGAGKTTTINMLTGLARPDSGSIHIAGIDCVKQPRAAQHLIGVVPDESNLYPELSGFDNLCFCAALYGIGKAERGQRAHELLAAFGLTTAADRKFSTYSKGMKRRLTIAAGLIHRPRILFLDEPTTGIDVPSARQLRQLIAGLRRDGTTVFMTTHYIEEAERLCDRIAFIVDGRIVRIDTVDNLLQPVQDKHILQIACSDAAGLPDQLGAAFPELEFAIIGKKLIRVEADMPIRVGPLVRFLEERQLDVFEARKIQPTLEDVFVRVTGVEAGAMRKEKAGGDKP